MRLILHQLFFVLFGTDLYLSDGLNQFPVLRDGKHGEKADWDKDMATVRALVEQEAARIVVERAEGNLAAAQSAERYPGGTVGGVPKFNPENVAYVERSNSAAEE